MVAVASGVLLHALNVVKKDGSSIYTAGNIGKDPALIGGYISAFSSMEREFKFNNKSEISGLSSQFHRIGDVLMVLVGDNEIITYGVFGEAPSEKIDALISIVSKIHKLFREEVWINLTNDQKEIGLIPPEKLEAFEQKLFSYFTKKKFRENITLSILYLNSEAGYLSVLWFLNYIFKKIKETLGKSLFLTLLNRIERMIQLDIDLELVIRVNNELDIVKPKNLNIEKFIVILSEVIYEIMKSLQSQFGNKILEELSIFGGIKFSF